MMNKYPTLANFNDDIWKLRDARATYRVTIQLVTTLPLTSIQKFRFGLARPG